MVRRPGNPGGNGAGAGPAIRGIGYPDRHDQGIGRNRGHAQAVVHQRPDDTGHFGAMTKDIRGV